MNLRIGTLFAAVLLTASTAGAMPITLTFDSSLLFGQPGTTVTFVGTVTDVGNTPTFLNADNVTVAPPLLPDDLPFFTNFPALLLPSQVVKAPILNVGIPLTTTAGLYSGTLQLLGGISPVFDNVLATQSFAVQVQPATPQAVPEPITAVLLLGGGTIAALRHTGRRLMMRRRAQAGHDHQR
jgi:hypothetical protein